MEGWCESKEVLLLTGMSWSYIFKTFREPWILENFSLSFSVIDATPFPVLSLNSNSTWSGQRLYILIAFKEKRNNTFQLVACQIRVMEMSSLPCKRGYWGTKNSVIFPRFPKSYMALVTREKFHLVWSFPSLEGQRRCFAVADECCSGHSWIEQDTIHLSGEANPVIQDKGPSSLGLKEDSPDLDSSPTYTHKAGAAAATGLPGKGWHQTRARCCCLCP